MLYISIPVCAINFSSFTLVTTPDKNSAYQVVNAEGIYLLLHSIALIGK